SDAPIHHSEHVSYRSACGTRRGHPCGDPSRGGSAVSSQRGGELHRDPPHREEGATAVSPRGFRKTRPASFGPTTRQPVSTLGTLPRLPASPRVGAYAIDAEPGRGAMGVVYRARDPRLDRSVAIKALPPEFADDETRLARFEREARLMAGLNHPNIATVYGLE